jgi:ribosomal protein S27E
MSYNKMERINRYTIREDEIIKIDCPKCKGKQGIRRKGSLKVDCFVCNNPIGEFDF